MFHFLAGQRRGTSDPRNNKTHLIVLIQQIAVFLVSKRHHFDVLKLKNTVKKASNIKYIFE
jgi:hypothetical protein